MFDEFASAFESLFGDAGAMAADGAAELLDAVAASGIDPSTLSAADLEVLGDVLHGTAEGIDPAADVGDGAIASGPPAVTFGQTVEFPDGTQIDHPHQDSLGSVYKSSTDYMAGANPHTLSE